MARRKFEPSSSRLTSTPPFAFHRLVTPITISTLTLILLRDPNATPPNPRMSFQISQPDKGPSAECVRLYLCRDTFRIMMEMVGQWWWLFGCSRELEEEIREEVRKRREGVKDKEMVQEILVNGF